MTDCTERFIRGLPPPARRAVCCSWADNPAAAAAVALPRGRLGAGCAAASSSASSPDSGAERAVRLRGAGAFFVGMVGLAVAFVALAAVSAFAAVAPFAPVAAFAPVAFFGFGGASDGEASASHGFGSSAKTLASPYCLPYQFPEKCASRTVGQPSGGGLPAREDHSTSTSLCRSGQPASL